MDFSQLINDYMNIKRLRGMTPSSRESAQIFAPYFNRQAQNNIEGQRLNLAERGQALAEQTQTAKQQQATEGLAWDKEKAINALALQKWQQQQLMDAAGRQDTAGTIGDVIKGVGGLGNLYMLKRFGYLK